MNDRNQQLLNEEIQNELTELRNLPFSDEGYEAVIDGVTKLMDRSIEMQRINLDAQERAKAREDENALKERQLEDEKRDRLIKNIVAGLTLAASVALPVWGTFKSLKFEETGTVTTLSGKAWINKMFPKA